jgi:hypothetical protein
MGNHYYVWFCRFSDLDNYDYVSFIWGDCMNEMEMRNKIAEYCDTTACVGCNGAKEEDTWCNYHNPNNIPIDQLKPIMESMGLIEKTEIEADTVEEVAPIEHDVIKHPNHYCREGAMECIDEMVMVFGKEVVKNFCLCNIWKYRYRSAAKNGTEDINKSDQYVRIYRELCSNG